MKYALFKVDEHATSFIRLFCFDYRVLKAAEIVNYINLCELALILLATLAVAQHAICCRFRAPLNRPSVTNAPTNCVEAFFIEGGGRGVVAGKKRGRERTKAWSTTYLKSIVGPAAELHDACLLVERKVFDINFAGAFVNRRRTPLDASCVVEGGLCGQRHLEVAIGTARQQ